MGRAAAPAVAIDVFENHDRDEEAEGTGRAQTTASAPQTIAQGVGSRSGAATIVPATATVAQAAHQRRWLTRRRHSAGTRRPRPVASLTTWRGHDAASHQPWQTVAPPAAGRVDGARSFGAAAAASRYAGPRCGARCAGRAPRRSRSRATDARLTVAGAAARHCTRAGRRGVAIPAATDARLTVAAPQRRPERAAVARRRPSRSAAHGAVPGASSLPPGQRPRGRRLTAPRAQTGGPT